MSSRFSVMLSRPSVFLFEPSSRQGVDASNGEMEETSGRLYRLVGCLRSTEALDGVKLVRVRRSWTV